MLRGERMGIGAQPFAVIQSPECWRVLRLFSRFPAEVLSKSALAGRGIASTSHPS